jgi:hypothetical protein
MVYRFAFTVLRFGQFLPKTPFDPVFSVNPVNPDSDNACPKRPLLLSHWLHFIQVGDRLRGCLKFCFRPCSPGFSRGTAAFWAIFAQNAAKIRILKQPLKPAIHFTDH